jgi:hypothetical protein
LIKKGGVSLVFQVIDFAKFEDIFKLGSAIVGEDTIDSRTPKSERKQARKVETVSLLDANRLKTVGELSLSVNRQNSYANETTVFSVFINCLSLDFFYI